jgi:hypothetical protein
MGMNLMSSTLVFDDASGDPFHVMQARHVHAAWLLLDPKRDARPKARIWLEHRDRGLSEGVERGSKS